MLPVVLLALLGQQLGPCGVDGPIYCGGQSFAFFEFAPTSGRGMTAACTCTSPTGAKGETLTLTRASNGTCLKSGTTSGIANGDMVTCSTNQPRVMPGGDGSGGNGLLVEGPRTNSCLRSQELDNAAWTSLANGVAAATITADATAQPDGTTTAERLQIPATTGAQYSVRAQAATVTGAASASCFVKGNASSGTTDICLNNNTAGSNYNCAACAFVSGSYNRCKVENVANAGANGTLLIGNATGVTGGLGARSAADIFVTDCQWEVGAFASSYIATAGAAVTRAAETASFALPAAMNASTGSHAVTFVPQWSTGVTVAPYLLIYDTEARALYKNAGDGINLWDGTNDVTNATTWTAGTAKRVWSSYTGSTAQVNDGADTTSGSFDGTFGAGALSTLHVGEGLGSHSFGVVKRVCADPSSTRCR